MIKKFTKFNEDSNSDLLDLKEFCNSYLSYLKDIGLGIDIEVTDFKLKSGKLIFTIIIGSHDIFKYDDIKDDLIQFLNILEDNYNIRKEIDSKRCVEIKNTYDNRNYEFLSIDNLDRLDLDFKFNFIRIYVITK